MWRNTTVKWLTSYFRSPPVVTVTRLYSSKLEEKKQRALLGGGQERLDKQHSQVSIRKCSQ